MSGFEFGPFTFVADDGFTAVEALEDGDEVAVEDFDKRFDHPQVASWVLARLVALVDRDKAERALFLSRDAVEEIEDAVYVVDFVVSRGDEMVAKVQVQGGAIGVGVLGVVMVGLGPAVVDALAGALSAAPDDVAEAEVRVVDPKDGRVVRHGFDGSRFLVE